MGSVGKISERETFINSLVSDIIRSSQNAGDTEENPISNSDIQAAVEAYALTNRLTPQEEETILNEVRDRVEKRLAQSGEPQRTYDAEVGLRQDIERRRRAFDEAVRAGWKISN